MRTLLAVGRRMRAGAYAAVTLAALAAFPCHGQDADDNTPPSLQALHAHRASSPAAMLATFPASAWAALDPENTLYLRLPEGRVVIELAPQFAPRYVANIKKLVRQGFFDGLPIFRVQDNGVAEWGDTTGRKSVGTARRTVAAEFERPARDLPFTQLPGPDTYAPQAGFSDGLPAARDPEFGRAWLVNCYGMVGAARGNNVDSGGGTALYAIIGGPERQLDRNTTMIGRVVQGMPLLSSLPRGHGPLGVYMNPDRWVRIESVRVAADVPPAERIPLEVLRTDTPSFTRYLETLRNRRGPWFKVPAGHIDVCSVPIPVRPGP
ncbi:MAG TPA: peptidylprolyl isomerase [Steroidobacteraceae bacterium]|nr:peptidylprolyl isomerase [Steroidobacteraceae bacterium]